MNPQCNIEPYLCKAVETFQTSQGRLIDNLNEMALRLYFEDEMKRLSLLMQGLRDNPSYPQDDEDKGEL